MNNQTKTEGTEIDLLHLIKLLWHRAWIIVLCMVLAGAIALSYAIFFVTPMYKSTAMMYVNNSSFSVGDTSFSISSGELSAAKSLLDIYVIILKTRTTLEQVIEEADLDYTYEQLSGMVSASSVNSTEVFSITVTDENPAEAELIVDTIVRVLPDRISDIVDGSSVRLVDDAVLPTRRSSPSFTMYSVVGMAIGLVLSCAVIIIIDMLDTTVRDEEYLKSYGIPILAIVPDVSDTKRGRYGYYYSSYSYGGYGRTPKHNNTDSKE